MTRNLHKILVAGCATAALMAGLGACARSQPPPECEAGRRLALVAQAVPSATFVPCVVDEDERPAGWSFGTLDVENDVARFWLNSDRAGLRAVKVEFTESCDVKGATRSSTEDRDDVERHVRVSTVSVRLEGTIYDVFDGGCVSYGFDFERDQGENELFQDFQTMTSLFPRAELRGDLGADLGLELDP